MCGKVPVTFWHERRSLLHKLSLPLIVSVHLRVLKGVIEGTAAEDNPSRENSKLENL